MTSYWYWWTIGAPQLTVICYSTHPVTVWSLPFLWNSHHPNVVGGASLQCSQDGGVTAYSCHLQGPFWWGVHIPWLSGVLDSVVHSSLSKGMPCYCQSWRSVSHTRSDTDTHHLAGWYSQCLVGGTCKLNDTMKGILKQLQLSICIKLARTKISEDTGTVIELEA